MGFIDWLRKQIELRLVSNRIVVTQKNFKKVFSQPIDSTKEYFIDGIIDIDGLSTSIEVPLTGIEIKGYSFDTSQIICTDNSFVLFPSPVGGSGNVLDTDVGYEISGTSSKVYDLVSATGSEAIEHNRVNFNNCTSLGTIDNYRQGLESGTGRFGGTPDLTLKGAWNGYRVTTTIIRNIDNAMTNAIFRAGVGFVMANRFTTDINADLGTLAPLIDFAPSNFTNPSTLQIQGAIISRNGVFDATDLTISPNITKSDLASFWKNNTGIDNTFVGGTNTITTQVTTTVSTISTLVNLAGTFTASGLQHYDSPANGQLRHLGNTPRDYKIFSYMILDSKQGDTLRLAATVFDDSASSTSVVFETEQIVLRLAGSRDVAMFTIIVNVTLDKDDYVYFQCANESGTTNITAELNSYFIVEER